MTTDAERWKLIQTSEEFINAYLVSTIKLLSDEHECIIEQQVPSNLAETGKLAQDLRDLIRAIDLFRQKARTLVSRPTPILIEHIDKRGNPVDAGTAVPFYSEEKTIEQREHEARIKSGLKGNF